MWTPATLTSGETTGYGFGWFIGVYGGHRYISHAGGIPGFSCYIVRFRDEKLTVLWLTNLDFGDPFASATGIARFYLSAPKPIRDIDPATTQRLKAVLLNLAEGQADPAQFTPEAEATLLTEIKQASMFYRSLGPLNSLSLIEQKS